MSWEDIRPSLGASPEPYYIDVHAIHKQGNNLMIARQFLTCLQLSLQVPYNDWYRSLTRRLTQLPARETTRTILHFVRSMNISPL